MKHLLKSICLIILLVSNLVLSQNDDRSITTNDENLIEEIKEYQTSENKKFGDPEKTILEPNDFNQFETFYAQVLNTTCAHSYLGCTG